jgi:hypothetical protein
MSLLISGALNSIAELFGTADRSTNIDVVTCVSSGFGGGALVSGATGLLACDVHATVIATMHAAAATVTRLICVAPTATMTPPALAQYRASR